MSKYEITQAQWVAVMGSNPSHFSDCKNCPVEKVSWNEVQIFIATLNQQTGKTYRLPTEAEWEYACRAGTATAYNTGSSLRISQANFDDGYHYRPIAVGSYAPNAWGLYDMHGNVSEWTSDLYLSSYEQKHRGGGWNSFADVCRSAASSTAHSDSSSEIGFRLVSF
jgi:formylglycine-generating enzyme required for sulfatase activity